jgi:hypothetical protein
MHGSYNKKKYITKAPQGYKVYRTMNHKQIHYGWHPSFQKAYNTKCKLIFHNWNEKYAGINIQRRLGENRYIYKYGSTYRIFKHNPQTGKQEYYDTAISTLEEARMLRDWWEEHNWDWGEI